MSQRNEFVASIQELLVSEDIDGWLFYDFRGTDPIGHRILGLDIEAHATRRWFYWIPARGEPVRLVHRIEAGRLDELPGDKLVYLRWEQLKSFLQKMLVGCRQVAMQYSADNAIPYVSKVDAGTVELVRSCGVDVVSAADLIQKFEAVWSPATYEQHCTAARAITEIVEQAFQWAGEKIRTDSQTDEYAIQSFILKEFEQAGLITDFPPIVAVNANASNPHYAPSETEPSPVGRGDLLLIDLWARVNSPDSVFADITWMGYFGSDPPAKIEKVFDIVVEARDRGVELLRERLNAGETPAGWEVDDAVRRVIEEAGFGEYFVHRTGHNVGRMVHGNGVNFDNLETHDTRRVIPGLCCTIEPGIYLPEFGVRSELNVFVKDSEVDVTTPPQRTLLKLT